MHQLIIALLAASPRLTSWVAKNPQVPGAVSVPGPMARSVDDLRVVLEAIQGPDGVDSEVPPVPWSDASAVERRDLRVATVPPLAEFEVQKEIRSALDTLTEELRANGAQVTPCVADVDLKEQVQLGDQLFWCIANTFESQEDVPSATLETYLGYLDRRDTLIVEVGRLLHRVGCSPPCSRSHDGLPPLIREHCVDGGGEFECPVSSHRLPRDSPAPGG
jgi:Amidase